MLFFGMEPTPRRLFLSRALQGAALVILSPMVRRAHAASAPPEMTVYKDPNCGCCTQWVAHVRKAGFAVTVRDTADMDGVKASFGVPAALHSCHTARVGRYSIEGHVPADLVQRLLAEAPDARGLAVPGMPVGSPGMEMGARKDRYDVLLFDKAGRTTVFATR
jgi:hypothetical protein